MPFTCGVACQVERQCSVSGGDPVALGSHPTTAVPFPRQLYGATQRLRLARSQHAQRVRQLQEEMAQLVPAGRVAELQRLLENELCCEEGISWRERKKMPWHYPQNSSPNIKSY